METGILAFLSTSNCTFLSGLFSFCLIQCCYQIPSFCPYVTPASIGNQLPALGTWAPVQKAGNYKLDIFVDKCSVEIFLNGGKIAMTNLIFPTTPYNQMSFYSRGGAFKVDRCKIYRL